MRRRAQAILDALITTVGYLPGLIRYYIRPLSKRDSRPVNQRDM